AHSLPTRRSSDLGGATLGADALDRVARVVVDDVATHDHAGAAGLDEHAVAVVAGLAEIVDAVVLDEDVRGAMGHVHARAGGAVLGHAVAEHAVVPALTPEDRERGIAVEIQGESVEVPVGAADVDDVAAGAVSAGAATQDHRLAGSRADRDGGVSGAIPLLDTQALGIDALADDDRLSGADEADRPRDGPQRPRLGSGIRGGVIPGGAHVPEPGVVIRVE